MSLVSICFPREPFISLLENIRNGRKVLCVSAVPVIPTLLSVRAHFDICHPRDPDSRATGLLAGRKHRDKVVVLFTSTFFKIAGN